MQAKPTVEEAIHEYFLTTQSVFYLIFIGVGGGFLYVACQKFGNEYVILYTSLCSLIAAVTGRERARTNKHTHTRTHTQTHTQTHTSSCPLIAPLRGSGREGEREADLLYPSLSSH